MMMIGNDEGSESDDDDEGPALPPSSPLSLARAESPSLQQPALRLNETRNGS